MSLDVIKECLKIKEYDDIYDANDNYHQLGYKNANKELESRFIDLFLSLGFVILNENEIKQNHFIVLYKQDIQINISYFKARNRLTILFGPYKEINLKYDAIGDNQMTLAQLARNGAKQSSSGLSLIFQLEDDSYFIIDGGGKDTQDTIKLYSYLRDNYPHQGKIPIRWLFTHAHHDHMELAIDFLNDYQDEIDVLLFSYNFPDFKSLKITREPQNRIQDSLDLIAKFEELRNKYYQNVPIHKHHCGDIIQIGNFKMTCLLNHEGYYPNEFYWINDTSSSFLVETKDKKVVFLGDSERGECIYLNELYSSYLKADILQLTHHGLNGGYLELYQNINPDTCLWSIDENRYLNSPYCLGLQPYCEHNLYIRDENIKKREHYNASNDVILKL